MASLRWHHITQLSSRLSRLAQHQSGLRETCSEIMNWVGGKLQTASQKQRSQKSIVARQKEHFANARKAILTTTRAGRSFNSRLPIDAVLGPDKSTAHILSARSDRQSRLEDFEETSAIANRLSSMKARPPSPSKSMKQKRITDLLSSTKSRHKAGGMRSEQENVQVAQIESDDNQSYRPEKLLRERLLNDNKEYEVQ